MVDPINAVNPDLEQSDVNLMLAYGLDLSPADAKKDPKIAVTAHAVLAVGAAKTAHHLMTSGAPQNSDPNFDAGMEDFLKNLAAVQAAQSSGSSNNGPGPAVDPNFPPCPFNPNNVPSSPSDVVAEMRQWLNYIEAYKQDPNAIFGFLQWTANVQANMGNYSQDGQNMINKAFFSLTNVTFGGQSLADVFVQALQNAYFFDPTTGQSNQDSCTNGLNYLLSMFSGPGQQTNWFVSQICYSIQARQANLPSYFIANEDPTTGDPKYTVDQFWIYQEGLLASSMTQNDSFKTTMRQMFMDQIDYLIAHCKSGILPQMIMSTLGDNMDMQQQGLGGYGALSDTMNGLSTLESQLNKLFSNSNMGPGDAQNFMDTLTQLLFAADSKNSILGPVVPGSINTLYNDITGMSDPTQSGGPTIGQLMNSNPPDWTQIATIFNNNKPSGTTTPTSFQTISGDLKDVDTGLSSQTQVISTAEGTITSKINTLQSSIKDMMITQYSEGWLNAIVQNQGKANQ
jgi:hypothetical protein